MVRDQPRNFLIRTGFVTRPAENSSKLKRAMFLLAHVRRLLPPLPRDYIRRRRAVRRITNVLLIATLSLISAYFITRPIGGTGFPARNLPASRVPAPTPVPSLLCPLLQFRFQVMRMATSWSQVRTPSLKPKTSSCTMRSVAKNCTFEFFIPILPGSTPSLSFRTGPAARRIAVMDSRATGRATAT